MAGEQTVSSAQTIRMSFSGQDADVYAYIPSSDTQNQTKLVYLDSIQTLSVSVFRDKVPVRAIGYVNVKGHTRGPRTIAGSMIFAVMNFHPLIDLLSQTYAYDFSYDSLAGQASSSNNIIYPDTIPPFNLLILYQNELGSAAVLELVGVDITNDGIVTSIEDLLTEKSIQYRARDLKRFKAVQGANTLEPGGLFTVGDFTENVLLNGELGTGSALSQVEVPAATGQSVWQKMKSLVT